MDETLKEDGVAPAPVNSAGNGGVDGIGVGPRGEPGVKRKKLRDMFRRKTVKELSNGA